MPPLCLLDSPQLVAESAQRGQSAISGLFQVRAAREPWELLGYGALRQAVFCREQKLFSDSDLDEHDRVALPIVAVSCAAGMALDVIGTVRIHESAPGLWYGSRLAIDGDWRGVASLAAQLIRAAVCTAHDRGAHTFLAHVQRQNVPLFRRLRWNTIGDRIVCGVLHHLMQADLNWYPPEDRLAIREERPRACK